MNPHKMVSSPLSISPLYDFRFTAPHRHTDPWEQTWSEKERERWENGVMGNLIYGRSSNTSDLLSSPNNNWFPFVVHS